MTMTLIRRPTADACTLPPTSPAVTTRMCRFADAIGGLFDSTAGVRDPLFGGCIVMPFANMAIGGTACHRPLIFREGEAMGDETRRVHVARASGAQAVRKWRGRVSRV